MSRTLPVLLAAFCAASAATAQTPASGPKDIVIENNLIADVIPLDAVAAGRGSPAVGQGDAVIDATGKYVLPGLIDAHAHLQEERGGKPQPLEYELNIWLACGITTVRDVGSDTKRALEVLYPSGIPYHGPTLMARVKEIVAQARTK
jgi:imidazolonepropionase-like amidohydrolase